MQPSSVIDAPVPVTDDGGPAPRARARRWRPSLLTLVITVLGIGGVCSGLYPMTAAWVSSYNQSQVLTGYEGAVRDIEPSAAEQLALAHEYNDALSAGVVLGENANVPVGDGTLAGSTLEYAGILNANAQGLMARVRIPSIDVDIPVYHGTSDAVLLRGAGHLEGSHFPVGGAGTRAVVTAHRGLANATMFTDLDRVQLGDTVTVETFGTVLTYRVRDIEVIDPHDSGTIRPEAGEDLLTLITCTPLGINSHRIVVTGERITPTPERDVQAAGEPPTIPGFPWWAVLGAGGVLIVVGYMTWQGFIEARAPGRGHRTASQFATESDGSPRRQGE